MNDTPNSVGAGSPGEDLGEVTQFVPLCDGQGAEVGGGRPGDVEPVARFVKERAALQARWTASALYEPPMSDYTMRAIYADAERAVKFGQTPDFACPYPFLSEEGKLWKSVYLKAKAAKEANHG